MVPFTLETGLHPKRLAFGNHGIEDEIKKAEQYEARKLMLLRLLEDPQVQQKIVSFLRRRLGTDPRG